MRTNVCVAMVMALVWSGSALAQARYGPYDLPAPTSGMINGKKKFDVNFDKAAHAGANGGISQFQLASKVADCLAERNDKAAELLGGAMSDDPKYSHLVTALKGKYRMCNTAVEAGVPLVMINGALAERLVEGTPRPLEDRAKSVNVTTAEPFYTNPGGRTIGTVGRCIAVYSPGLAYKLLSTPASSPQENAALDTVYRATPECGMSRQPSGISADEQRSAIAAGLYHWINKG